MLFSPDHFLSGKARPFLRISGLTPSGYGVSILTLAILMAFSYHFSRYSSCSPALAGSLSNGDLSFGGFLTGEIFSRSGSFILGNFTQSCIGLLSLLREICSAVEVWPNLWYMPILLLTSERCLLSASSSPIFGRRISLVSLSSH